MLQNVFWDTEIQSLAKYGYRQLVIYIGLFILLLPLRMV